MPIAAMSATTKAPEAVASEENTLSPTRNLLPAEISGAEMGASGPGLGAEAPRSAPLSVSAGR
ncbi:hypothetical protein GCM10009854_09950 [Saccharopolyspora halophila]|uniref:Uncharacterized protein n=1 Tax=Saccharopolyspora halophila TaxID=405551 RepID=A0ABN3FRJ7_9PSEU